MSDSLLFAPGTAATAPAADDAAFAQAMLDVEAAWVQAQADLGLATAEAAAAVRAAATVEHLDLPAIGVRAENGANALIPLLAQLRQVVRDVDPAAERWVHRGLTSQDVLDTALILLVREAARATSARGETVAGALRDLATRHRDTPMVGRTLGQHAVPYTFGLKAATWLQGVDTALTALAATTARLPVQCGGASGTLAAVAAFTTPAGVSPLDLVDRLADRLGLAPSAPWHTARLPLVQAVGALALVADALGKIATDVLTLSRPEIDELAEPAAAGRGGSSAMPQKRNPVLSVLIRRTALTLPHQVAQLHLAAALADDERPDGAWHSEWPAVQAALRLVPAAAAAAAELTGGLEVHTDRMLQTLRDASPGVLSERLTAAVPPLLADDPTSGMRDAKERVTAMIAGANGTADLWNTLRAAIPADRCGDAALDELLDPTTYLGAAGELTDRIVAHSAAAARGRDAGRDATRDADAARDADTERTP